MSIITENSNPLTKDIDLLGGGQIAKLINDEDKKVAEAVEKIVEQVGEAIEEVAKRLRCGGRMAYFGAGTSGRIGILDATEMLPTFGVDDMVYGYIAGGEKALLRAVENAEDKEELAEEDFKHFNPDKNDVVVAVSACGNPQYTLKVMQLARERGVLTIGLSSNPEAAFKPYTDIFLNPVVGAEVITGSSRMKSGTAQKMVLNMLSTGVMIRLGKTYHNYMVDLQMTNAKLRDRAVRIVSEICKVYEEEAEKVLQKAGSVKTACVMIIKKCDKENAEALLAANEGILRKVIG